MDKENIDEVFKIDEKLAKAIVNRNFYFSSHNKESEFSQLPGHYQRAINREAEFQVKTLAQTEDFANILNENNMEEAQKLHDALCEYYAHKGNLDEKNHPYHPKNFFNLLLQRDSEAIIRSSFDNLAKKDDKFYNEGGLLDRTTRRAAQLNEHIAEDKAKGKKHDASLNIANIVKHINMR